MLSGLFGSILENNKLKLLIPSFIISFILYFVFPAIINLATISFMTLGIVFCFAFIFVAVFLKRLGENMLWIAYFFFAIGISFNSAFWGSVLVYTMRNFSNIYYPLIYLAGYVVNFLLYFVFNMVTDKDPIGPVIVVFVGLMVVSMAAAFIALFAFNYPVSPYRPAW